MSQPHSAAPRHRFQPPPSKLQSCLGPVEPQRGMGRTGVIKGQSCARGPAGQPPSSNAGACASRGHRPTILRDSERVRRHSNARAMRHRQPAPGRQEPKWLKVPDCLTRERGQRADTGNAAVKGVRAGRAAPMPTAQKRFEALQLRDSTLRASASGLSHERLARARLEAEGVVYGEAQHD